MLLFGENPKIIFYVFMNKFLEVLFYSSAVQKPIAWIVRVRDTVYMASAWWPMKYKVSANVSILSSSI